MRTGTWILALLAAAAWPVRAQEFHFGNDLSYVNQMEDCGAVFREAGEPKDVYGIFADRGTSLVRVRLWVDPSWWQVPLSQPAGVKPMYGDLADVRETVRRAKDAGMQVLLDFQYSDFWADPGRQLIPKAWVWAANDLEAMKGLVYQYTKDVLTTLDAEGLMPEMVQVGNEITNGLLKHIPPASGWDPAGTVSGGWSRYAQLLNEAIRAVREVGAAASVNPKIAIHLAGGLSGYLWRFWNDVLGSGVTDFDIMGISYYYAWHGGDLAELEYEVADMATTFPDYEVMVLETAYPWTTQNFDSLPNIVTSTDPDYHPVSPGKQLEYLTDYTRAVMRAGGSGVVFWEPAWVSTPCRTPWGRGSSHDHLVFFDPIGNDFIEAGGGRWMERTFYENLDAPKVLFKVDMSGQDVSEGVFISGDFGIGPGQVAPMARLVNDVWYHYTYLPAGTMGTFHFRSGPDGQDRETVPSACTGDGGVDRAFTVSATGGEYAFVWGACATNVGLGGSAPELPGGIVLSPAYPNPFRSATTLSFGLPRAGRVSVAVFDLTGRRVRTLVDGWKPAGTHEVTFASGGLPSGPYLCRLDGAGAGSAAVLVIKR